MANPEHLEILKQGVEAWNEWRSKNPQMVPDLSRTSLTGPYLTGVYLTIPYLRRANLNGANLRNADLRSADLYGADLSAADLSQACLSGAKLYGASLDGTSLDGASFNGASLNGVSLVGANLAGANLVGANLSGANLSGTNLSGANLAYAGLSGAALGGADFTSVRLGYTSFADNDLSQVKGLEAVKHSAPSAISIDTIFKSQGNIPEVFLRGCGVAESFIVHIPALVAAMQPIEFYSCFISYSSKDQQFADRLHADLRAKGVRVWFAPHDLPIGARVRPAIDESIHVYDKLLLVLSEHSVSSQWVEQEVETALRKERRSGGTALFPIRLDDTVLEAGEGWPALVKDTRHIGDFTRWKEHDSYREAFDRLLRDLRAEGKIA